MKDKKHFFVGCLCLLAFVIVPGYDFWTLGSLSLGAFNLGIALGSNAQ